MTYREHELNKIAEDNLQMYIATRSLCSATSYADNVALPAFAGRTPAVQHTIDISCPPGPQQQTGDSGYVAVSCCRQSLTITSDKLVVKRRISEALST